MASLFYLLLLFLSPFLSHSSDPDPLQDFCIADLKSSPSASQFRCKPPSEVTSDDFFFNGLANEEGNITNPFGWKVTPANVFTFPALNTLGISMNRVDLLAGGLNPPHSHPRATETGVVIYGKVLVGFVTTGNVYYSKVLLPGEMFVVPRGLVHFQKSVGGQTARILTAFNSHNPGSVVVPQTLFASKPAIPDHVLSQTFQMDSDLVHSIQSKFGN